MFTGIVQSVGTVLQAAARGNGLTLRIRHTLGGPALAVGESVAVQGVCLSVREAAGDVFVCDVLRETVEHSTFAGTATGRRVNLERALRAGDSMGGHIVTGHVDGTGRVVAVEQTGPDWRMRVGCSETLLRDMVYKGSVACDGVSLTIAGLDGEGFTVCLIPLTWRDTTLQERRPGDAIHVETDILAKYVRRALDGARPGARVDEALLRDSGFFG